MTYSRLLRRTVVLAGGGILCALAASCELGPDYRRPDLGIDAPFKSATTQESAAAPGIGRDWWRLFGDPVLDDLEHQAIAANTDIRPPSPASPRPARPPAHRQPVLPGRHVRPLDRAHAAPRATASSSAPTARPSPRSDDRPVHRRRRPVRRRRRQAGKTTTSVRIPFDLSYEIDIWGRVRRSVEASAAQEHASEADFEVVLQTLEADVAQNYFTLRSLDAQDLILHSTVESYRQQLDADANPAPGRTGGADGFLPGPGPAQRHRDPGDR